MTFQYSTYCGFNLDIDSPKGDNNKLRGNYVSVVYIAENGAVLGIEANRLTIKYKDGLLKSLPIETVDGITMLGKNQLTTQCMETNYGKGDSRIFLFKRWKIFRKINVYRTCESRITT